jgi:hypothetical protein
MRRIDFRRSAAPVAAVLTALLLTSACGDESDATDTPQAGSGNDDGSSAAARVDTSAAEGDWLLALQTAGGADAETATTVYITYNPATGEASTRKMPPVKAGSAGPEDAGLLISADRQWAIPDTEITNSEKNSGKLKVYSLARGDAALVDIRKATGDNGLKALGWAFDPQRPHTLRVVDTKNRVWAVDVTGGKAAAEAPLAKGPWFFSNGFNRNTGVPWVESIDSDATKPAGNGVADTAAITRDGGTVLANDAPELTKLAQPPCELDAAWVDADGTTWAFCVDKPAIAAYYLAKDGQEWKPFGKPSNPVAPEAAAFPLVLPPTQ